MNLVHILVCGAGRTQASDECEVAEFNSAIAELIEDYGLRPGTQTARVQLDSLTHWVL